MRQFLSVVTKIFWGIMFAILAPLQWLLGGWGGKEYVVFYSYPKFVYIWPVIVLGFVFQIPFLWNLAGAELLTWIWIAVFCLCAIALGLDIDRNYAAVVIVCLVALWLGLWNIELAKGIPVLDNIQAFFAGMDVSMNAETFLVISLLLAVPFLVMMVWVRINEKWKADVQTLAKLRFGHADQEYAWGAKTVRTSYPDWLEAVIALSGDVILYDSRGRGELQRIDNVVFAPVVKKKIDRFLRAAGVYQRDIVEDENTPSDDQEDMENPIP